MVAGRRSLLLAAAVYVEAKVAVDPIIPMRLFKDRTISLATVASVMIGVAMFGSTVYLSQYFQIARGMSPTDAGLMSIAMVGGLFDLEHRHRPDHQRDRAVEALPGRRHGPGRHRSRACSARSTRPPTWSPSASSWRSSASASARPCRTSCSSVQNNVKMSDMGSASAVVAFFRSMGGSIGISALGALLSYQVADKVTTGLAAIGIDASGHREPLRPGPVARLPGPVREVFEHAFGQAFGELFLVAVPFAVVALICVLLIKEVPLRTSNLEAEAEASPEVAAELHHAVVSDEPR